MSRAQRTFLAVVAASLAIVVLLPGAALGITRDTVLNRGKVWVNYARVDARTHKTVTGVPYSQSRWAYENGTLIPSGTSGASTLGYRTDCSGFASYCLGLQDSKGRPYSASTSEMGAKGSKQFYQISKGQLKPGDLILMSTVWGASVGHAIVFCGWADSKQKKFWAMEQTTTSSHNGTILRRRTYGQAYYRPYRYAGIEDPYQDVEQSASSVNAYYSAASAAEVAFPPASTTSVGALVVASASQWGDQVTAASLAGAVGGPVLLVSSNSLPSITAAEIKRLKPQRVYVLGSTKTIKSSVTRAIGALGTQVTRIGGSDRYQVAANALATTLHRDMDAKHPANVVYIVSGEEPAEALSIAPILAKTGRPVLFSRSKGMSSYVMRRLHWTGVKHVIILGGTKVIKSSVQKTLKKKHYKVSRIGTSDKYATSRSILSHGLSLGLSFDALGLVSTSSYADALAWSSATGMTGSLVILTPQNKLGSVARAIAARYRSRIGRARIFGGESSVSQGACGRLATALRTGK